MSLKLRLKLKPFIKLSPNHLWTTWFIYRSTQAFYKEKRVAQAVLKNGHSVKRNKWKNKRRRKNRRIGGMKKWWTECKQDFFPPLAVGLQTRHINCSLLFTAICWWQCAILIQISFRNSIAKDWSLSLLHIGRLLTIEQGCQKSFLGLNFTNRR